MAVGRHGEVRGNMAFNFLNFLRLCIVRIFFCKSQSQIIPHDGCSNMAVIMDRNWIECDRIWFEYGSDIDREGKRAGRPYRRLTSHRIIGCKLDRIDRMCSQSYVTPTSGFCLRRSLAPIDRNPLLGFQFLSACLWLFILIGI